MEEILDSIQEQGSTNKSKSTCKDTPNEYSSSMPVSQSEESYNYGESEVMQSVSDKKSAKRGRKRNIKAQDKKSNEGDELDEDFENSRGVNNENSAEVNYRIRRCLVPLGTRKSRIRYTNESSRGKGKSKGKEAKMLKTEQYKHQTIIDQYGVFEFDKDPEGYKKARKRQQNRESALRARDKRVMKMETVETRLERIKQKSEYLEKENMVLKAEKQQLQDQVKNLMSLLTSFGHNKRFKTGEKEELEDLNNDLKINNLIEMEELSENDDDKIVGSPKHKNPEKTMLKLIRNNDESMFDENSLSGFLHKGIMLSLTIVICMILCLTGFSLTENYYANSFKMCDTCNAPINPFDALKLTESKSQMSHPLEPHLHHDDLPTHQVFTFNLISLWMVLFLILAGSSLIFRKQQYKIYNYVLSPCRRLTSVFV